MGLVRAWSTMRSCREPSGRTQAKAWRRARSMARADQARTSPIELAKDHRLVEHELQVGLILRSDGEPAKAALHRKVGARLETKLIRVEVERLVIVEHKNGRVREMCDHGSSPFLEGTLSRARA